MPPRLNKRRALALLEEARLQAERGEWGKVEGAARRVIGESTLDQPAAFTLLAEALRRTDRRLDAQKVLEEAYRRFPKDADVEAHLGSLLSDLEQPRQALELLGRARARKPRDPAVLTHFAAALLKVGEVEAAEQQLAAALLVGGGPDTRLVLALVKARRGRLDEADALASQVEAGARNDPELSWAARAVRADLKLLRGEPAEALAAWRAIEAAGRLEGHQLGHMAYAAQVVGDTALADQLIARRRAQGAQADDLLLFAQIANVRGQPGQAQELLEEGERLGALDPGTRFEWWATKGRALRLLGRREQALTVLEQAKALPESAVPRLGASVFVDLGHLAAEAGDFEGAEQHLRRALELDPDEPEARRALALTLKRLAWRSDLESTAAQQVEAARAEAEALRRRFEARETEVERLRRELARLQAAQSSAEEAIRRAQEGADSERRRLVAEQQRKVREELETREREAGDKAKENLERAFGAARDRCPAPLWQMLLVAERTYQTAITTELPAAAVAVLFSGALERSLVELLVKPFDTWLEQGTRRQDFLAGAVREKRGKRVEYFDRFVDAFDRELSVRAPALGEVSRVLDRRHEAYLAPFRAFLAQQFSLEDAFFESLAAFVQWSKEKLRDPVAHGHIELDWDELKSFREKLLLRFGGTERGMLPRLIEAQRA
ncbi:MAG: tetratricopeptide repeat protein [Myxococcales bacterium]|nr:tetratricopeptide repeat protein [Myxococcales bacterium]